MEEMPDEIHQDAPEADGGNENEQIVDENPHEDGLEFDLVPVAGRAQENSWVLPNSLATYVNTNSRSYVTNRQLRELILENYPVPSNMDDVPALDEYVRAPIRASGNNATLSRDDELKAL